jgi:hypothetical protein
MQEKPGCCSRAFTLLWAWPVWLVVGRELPLFAMASLLGFGSLELWDRFGRRKAEGELGKGAPK